MKRIAFFIVVTAVIFSCKKNDSGTGTPVISGVRTVDPATKDSLFTRAVPGTLIVIQGNNLGGLQAVFFNDTSAYFNPSYATNDNIIIRVPATAQTAAANPNVTSTIKVVTDHGTATYTFTLYLPPPAITSLSFDNSGKVVFINGSNFQGIKKITFPVSGNDTALSYTVNKTFTQIIAEIPPGTPFNDSLRVFATFGKGAYSYPPPMTITSVSNENGAGGTTITVNGTNFVGISQVIFPGNLQGTNLQVISVNQLKVTVPLGIIVSDSLRIKGVLGIAASPQLFDSYITSGYSLKFEFFVKTTWSAGEIWIAVGGWYVWSSYTARFAPWETAPGGKYLPSGWVTATVPLTNFVKGNEFWQTSYKTSGAPASKFSDYPTTEIAFLIANDQASAVPANSINIAIDNVRIVKGQ